MKNKCTVFTVLYSGCQTLNSGVQWGTVVVSTLHSNVQ